MFVVLKCYNQSYNESPLNQDSLLAFGPPPFLTSKMADSKSNSKSNRKSTRAGKKNRAKHEPRRLSGSVANPILTVRHLPLFGLRTRKRLQYFEAINVTGSASSLVSQVFTGNGAYDPNITGTGHQPMGFDQMMVFFNHYTVLASRIRVVFQNNSAFTTHVGLMVSGSSAVDTNYQVNVENGEMIYTILTPSGIDGSIATLRTSVNTASFQGVQDAMDVTDLSGDVASNPAELNYYHLLIWNPVSASVPVVYCDTYIEYDVMFHEPRKATIS